MAARSEVRDPPAPTPIVRQEGPLATGERLRPFALAGLTVVLVALCAWLTVPFLPALAWGVALAVIAWPMNRWITRRVTENPVWAAALSSLVATLAVVVPGVFVAYQLVREAGAVGDHVQQAQAEGAIREKMAETPATSELVAWADRVGVDIDAEVRKAVTSIAASPAGVAQGSVMAILQALVALFILFHILKDRSLLLAGVRRFLPMTRPEADRVIDGAASSVYANLYATLITSAIDGVGGGLMFWLVGLPSPVLWGVVMFILSFLPILGTFLVWMPAAGYLVMTGNPGGAFALIAWGVASWLVNDNFIYVRIAGDHMQLHQVPSLIAFLGGLVLFGASGMILGPGILAVTAAVLDVWHRRVVAAELAGGSPSPAVA
jgi:predicted PurR-regulated permease PerM